MLSPPSSRNGLLNSAVQTPELLRRVRRDSVLTFFVRCAPSPSGFHSQSSASLYSKARTKSLPLPPTMGSGKRSLSADGSSESSRRMANGLPMASTAPTAITNSAWRAPIATVTKTVAFGLQPAFSADGQWAAYAIGRSEAQEEKLRKDKKPIQNKLGLTNLATGEQSEIEGIETFAFSPSGTWLAMRRYAPEKTVNRGRGW